MQKAAMARTEVQRVADDGGQPRDDQIRDWVARVLARSPARGDVVVRIVDEAESAALNQRFRGKQGPTNVLSFPVSPPDDVPAALAAELGAALGDIVICAPVVAREAREQGKDAQAHWAHMVLHGLLHLLGHDHITADQASEMESLEIEILAEIGYPDPYETSD